jgi:hypothetical protein
MRKEIKKLKQDLVAFENSIFTTKVIRTYPIVPMQLIAILANYKKRVFEIDFNTYVETERFEQIILQVIRNNDLFRSSIISKKGKLFIQEYEPANELKLPILDFSFLNFGEREKIREKIFKCKSIKQLGTKRFFIKFLAARHLFSVLNTIYSTNKKYWLINRLISLPLFHNHKPAHNYALGKFILVKNNSKEYKLILYLDHLSFDDMSLSHLIEEIKESYYSASYLSHKPLNYSNYAEHLRLGLDKNDPDVIIDKLKLNAHYNASKSINKKPSHSDHYLFKYHAVIKDKYLNELIEVAIFLSAVVCSKIFQVEKVPVTLVSGNRKFQEQNYYNTVGLIQDFVPILIELEKFDYEYNKNNINSCLNYISANNINILNIDFNKYDDENWHHVIKLLNIEKLITSEPVINLNIEFDSEKRGFNEDSNVSPLNFNQVSIVKSKDKSLVNNLKKKGGIIFWVDVNKNSINFNLESLFPIEEQYFRTFSEDINEFIGLPAETNNTLEAN